MVRRLFCACEASLMSAEKPSVVSGPDPEAARLLEPSGLRDSAAARHGGGRGHPASGHGAARAGPQALERAAYVQPSRRPSDGRYGENPNRLQHYYQYQVILKPNPADMQDLYLGLAGGHRPRPALHDIRFVEDDWENPTVGAWGLGWEVWCDGMEVTQYTYFQQVGGLDVCAGGRAS